jgi:hypothetical protein
VTAHLPAQEGNHVFVLTRSCTDRASELACGPVIDEMLAPGLYYLAVDGATAGELGRFSFDFLARDVSGQESACKSAPTLALGKTITGTTAGAGDRFTVSCAGREDAQASADRIYKIVLPERSRIRLTLSTPAWDGVLAIRKSCIDPAVSIGAGTNNEAACNNDFQDAHHSKVEATLDAGTYWVVVDGHAGKNEGAFTLDYALAKK